MKHTLPSSKSYTQRALFLAALTKGTSTIHNPLICDDSLALLKIIQACGISYTHHGNTIIIHGGTIQPPSQELNCQAAGTTARFCLTLPIIAPGKYTFLAHQSLTRRPMEFYFQFYHSIQSTIHPLQEPNCLPLTIDSTHMNLQQCETITIETHRSSQYLSAMLMTAPYLSHPINLLVTHDTVSKPYVAMTLAIMKSFNLYIEPKNSHYRLAPQTAIPTEYTVESDWSSFAYLYAAACIWNKRQIDFLTIGTLFTNPPSLASLQADVQIIPIIKKMYEPGTCFHSLQDCPDLIGAVVTIALLRQDLTILTDIDHIQFKESNRIQVLVQELSKLGANLHWENNQLIIHPWDTSPVATKVQLDPHGDHRMAFCFGILATIHPYISVHDPQCVSKSFPDFWHILKALHNRYNPDKPFSGCYPWDNKE